MNWCCNGQQVNLWDMQNWQTQVFNIVFIRSKNQPKSYKKRADTKPLANQYSDVEVETSTCDVSGENQYIKKIPIQSL